MADDQRGPTVDPMIDGLPELGLGTWQNDDHDQCVESVRAALEMGYRHVDTAQAYRNEDAVGEAIRSCDVPRDEIFLATKLWADNLAANDVRETFERSLQEFFQLEYVDLLYVHWPARTYDPAETLPAMAELVEEGLVRHVGVSNFEPHHVDRAREVLDVPVFANQVEMHPFLPQTGLREYAAETDLNLVAYSPLARGAVFDDPTIGAIADEYDASPAQVSLAWLRHHGVAAIPKATGTEHIRDNWESRSLELDEADVARIDDIDRRERVVHPDFAPDAWG